MRVPAVFVMPVVLLLATLGCAHRVYTIGVLNPESLRSLSSGSRVSLQKLPATAPFDHDAALERKMIRILKDEGYEISADADADFLVFYDYRVSGRMAEMKLELLSGPATGMHTVRRGGPYTHVLELRVVDARLYHRQEFVGSLVWEGGALLGDVPTESPKFHDIVLLAAFDQLGKTTGDQSNMLLKLNDPTARQLRKPEYP